MSGLNAVRAERRRCGAARSPARTRSFVFHPQGSALTAEGGSPDQEKKGCTGRTGPFISGEEPLHARGIEAPCLRRGRLRAETRLRGSVHESPVRSRTRQIHPADKPDMKALGRKLPSNTNLCYY